MKKILVTGGVHMLPKSLYLRRIGYEVDYIDNYQDIVSALRLNNYDFVIISAVIEANGDGGEGIDLPEEFRCMEAGIKFVAPLVSALGIEYLIHTTTFLKGSDLENIKSDTKCRAVVDHLSAQRLANEVMGFCLSNQN